jgi:EAL domain-containing protein (putative c-di-GMP-specific phosphodiesterase class I)
VLLQRADVAMYEAKRSNRGIVAWDDRYARHDVERLSLMGDLRKAIERDELCLVYQPKVSLAAPGECHVEALVRWRHPARGLVPPSDFVPFAEQTGYIRVITQWVLERAIAQCAAWRRDGLAMHASINLSARDLVDELLPERVQAVLGRERCEGAWFTFEITESAIFDDHGRALSNLERLRALGCRLAIDDYGTGYASLAYLRNLPVQELKIDKSFVLRLASDANDEIIVRSTIELAHNMGLVVVAEGVENEAGAERLREFGCDMMQGYWLSRPLPAEQLANWMRESRFLQAVAGPVLPLRRAG